jgi:hypothetical protein
LFGGFKQFASRKIEHQKRCEIKKKLGICLIVGVIAVALVSYGIVKLGDMQPVSSGPGGSHSIVIKAELPEAPETMPYYRVVDEDYDKPSLQELKRELRQKPQKHPSRDEAVRIAEEYIDSHGGMPDDAVFGDAIRGYLMKSGEDFEKRHIRLQVWYHRVFNGTPVVGPGDTIRIAIGCNGTIPGFLKSWRELEYAGEIEIVNASEAVERLQRGETVYNFSASPSTIEIDRMELGYYSAMPRVKQEYYEPVWVFSGKGRVTQSVWAGVVTPTPIPFQPEEIYGSLWWL